MYDGYHFGGMHLIWWFIWIAFIFLMFGWYKPVRKTNMKKDSALDILQMRFASGEMTKEEYEERKNILVK